MRGTIKEQLDSVFDPKSIAFVGASNDVSKWGGWVLQHALNSGFRGRLYPINPNQKIVQGIQTYQSVLDVPGDLETAVITVPVQLAIRALEECGQKGVKAAIVITAGFAEVGQKGQALQEELLRVARNSNIRVVGPNSMGIWSAVSRLCLPFDPPPKPGPIAFISQSGTFGVFLVGHALRRGYGFSRFVSAGNQADLSAADYLQYCDEDPETKVIVLYIEGLRDGRRFMEVAREVVKRKPIIVFKAGRTAAGGKMTMSHTGSLSGADEVFDVMCRQIGIIRTREATHAFDAAEALSKQPLPGGKRVGIVAAGGGFCVAVVDHCAMHGLAIPELGPLAQNAIKASLLEHTATPVNPVDTGGDGRPLVVPEIAERMAKLDYIDGIISTVPSIRGNPSDPKSIHELAQGTEIFVRIPKELGKPLILTEIPGSDELVKRMLISSGIPIYDNPEDAARAMAALMHYAELKRKVAGQGDEQRRLVAERSVGEASRSRALAIIEGALREGRVTLSEHEGKGVLEAYGIPVTRERAVKSTEELLRVLETFSLPIVMKVDSPDIIHKTEAGGIRLNVQTVEQAVEAFDDILQSARRYDRQARINGVLVQEMVTGGTECFIGMKGDPQFGPVILFGLGGIFVEVLKDVALRLANFTQSDAADMIRETKGFRVLAGARGQKPADIPAIEDVLLRFSSLALDLEQYVSEIDINPLMVGSEGTGAKALDTLIVLNRARIQ